MNYAILKTGGKQYRVAPGDVIDVEKLPAEEGSSLQLTDVLAVSIHGEVTIGTPLVPAASVLANVREHAKDKKIIVFKYKRKVRYRRKKGHRQSYTRLFISAIMLGDEEIGIPQRPELLVAYEEKPTVEETSGDDLQELDVVEAGVEVKDGPEEDQPDLTSSGLEEESAGQPASEPASEIDETPTGVLEATAVDGSEENVVDTTEAKPGPKATRKPRATTTRKPRATTTRKPRAKVKEDGT